MQMQVLNTKPFNSKKRLVVNDCKTEQCLVVVTNLSGNSSLPQKECFCKVPETCCRSTQTALSQTWLHTVKTNLSWAPDINNLLMHSNTPQIKLANT